MKLKYLRRKQKMIKVSVYSYKIPERVHRFADLHDSTEVRGENVTVNRMEIRSSVLTIFENGMCNMKTGPDMRIQVSLSNLKANQIKK